MRNKTQVDYVEAQRAGAAYVAEEIVRELMGDTSDSTEEENKVLDIDFWYNTTKREKRIPVSVKYMRVAEKTGRIAMELEVTYDGSSAHPDGKEWYQSWYYNGKARYYAIVIGRRVLVVNKAGLAQYVSEHGWLKIVTLSATAKLSQVNHAHKDSRCGLLDIESLIASGFASWQFDLTDEQVGRLTTQSRCDSVETNPITQQNSCASPILKSQRGYTNHALEILKSTQPTGGMRWRLSGTQKQQTKIYLKHDG